MLRIFYIVLSLCIFKICCEQKEKDLTPEMKNDLKAWCISAIGSNKGNNAWDATQKCCEDKLGFCFELPRVKIDQRPIIYCLVKSNSKDNAEKVKECCVSKKSKYKKHSGQDGYSVNFNGTNKYIDCKPPLKPRG